MTVPDAFVDAGAWFAATYIVVRAVGLGLYGRVAWDDVAKRAAVRKFAVLSLGGLTAVAAGGLVDGEARPWLWAAALLLDVVAAALAGAAEGWDICPDHFGERHGLFVIIVVGESLIVAAAGLILAMEVQGRHSRTRSGIRGDVLPANRHFRPCH